jgi:hypothetical protein
MHIRWAARVRSLRNLGETPISCEPDALVVPVFARELIADREEMLATARSIAACSSEGVTCLRPQYEQVM